MTDQRADIGRLIELENELAQLKKENGIAEKEPLPVRIIDFLIRLIHEPKKVSRRQYIVLALTLGWLCGAHRWYSGSKIWAVIYLLTAWTGFAAAMTIVDLVLVWLKYEPDENGMITI